MSNFIFQIISATHTTLRSFSIYDFFTTTPIRDPELTNVTSDNPTQDIEHSENINTNPCETEQTLCLTEEIPNRTEHVDSVVKDSLEKGSTSQEDKAERVLKVNKQDSVKTILGFTTKTEATPDTANQDTLITTESLTKEIREIESRTKTSANPLENSINRTLDRLTETINNSTKGVNLKRTQEIPSISFNIPRKVSKNPIAAENSSKRTLARLTTPTNAPRKFPRVETSFKRSFTATTSNPNKRVLNPRAEENSHQKFVKRAETSLDIAKVISATTSLDSTKVDNLNKVVKSSATFLNSLTEESNSTPLETTSDIEILSLDLAKDDNKTSPDTSSVKMSEASFSTVSSKSNRAKKRTHDQRVVSKEAARTKPKHKVEKVKQLHKTPSGREPKQTKLMKKEEIERYDMEDLVDVMSQHTSLTSEETIQNQSQLLTVEAVLPGTEIIGEHVEDGMKQEQDINLSMDLRNSQLSTKPSVNSSTDVNLSQKTDLGEASVPTQPQDLRTADITIPKPDLVEATVSNQNLDKSRVSTIQEVSEENVVEDVVVKDKEIADSSQKETAMLKVDSSTGGSRISSSNSKKRRLRRSRQNKTRKDLVADTGKVLPAAPPTDSISTSAKTSQTSTSTQTKRKNGSNIGEIVTRRENADSIFKKGQKIVQEHKMESKSKTKTQVDHISMFKKRIKEVTIKETTRTKETKIKETKFGSKPPTPSHISTCRKCKKVDRPKLHHHSHCIRCGRKMFHAKAKPNDPPSVVTIVENQSTVPQDGTKENIKDTIAQDREKENIKDTVAQDRAKENIKVDQHDTETVATESVQETTDQDHKEILVIKRYKENRENPPFIQDAEESTGGIDSKVGGIDNSVKDRVTNSVQYDKVPNAGVQKRTTFVDEVEILTEIPDDPEVKVVEKCEAETNEQDKLEDAEDDQIRRVKSYASVTKLNLEGESIQPEQQPNEGDGKVDTDNVIIVPLTPVEQDTKLEEIVTDQTTSSLGIKYMYEQDETNNEDTLRETVETPNETMEIQEFEYSEADNASRADVKDMQALMEDLNKPENQTNEREVPRTLLYKTVGATNSKQAFVQDLRQKTQDLIFKAFPQKIKVINDLLVTEKTKLAELIQSTNMDNAGSFFNIQSELKINAIKQSEYLERKNMTVDDNLVHLITKVKSLLQGLMQDINSLKVWMCMILSTESTSTQIQSDAQVQQLIHEIETAEKEAISMQDDILAYYVKRNNLISEIFKYPAIIHSHSEHILEAINYKQYIELQIILSVLRNKYSILHSLILNHWKSHLTQN